MKVPFVINQNRYNILDRGIEENGLKAVSEKRGKGIISFCSLAQGVLTDRYLEGIPEDSRIMTDGRFLKSDQVLSQMETVRRLNEVAVARGENLAQMALKWIMRDGVVTSMLVGASRPSQILENLKVLEGAPLSEEEIAEIDRICGR